MSCSSKLFSIIGMHSSPGINFAVCFWILSSLLILVGMKESHTIVSYFILDCTIKYILSNIHVAIWQISFYET